MAAEILNSSSLDIDDAESRKTMKSLVESVIHGGDHQDHQDSGLGLSTLATDDGSSSTLAAVNDNSGVIADLKDISMESALHLALTESLLVSRMRGRLLEVMEWLQKGAANITRYRLGVLRRTVQEQSAVLDCLLHRSGIMQRGLAPLPSVQSLHDDDEDDDDGDSPGSSSSSFDRRRRRQLKEITKFLEVVKTAVFKIKESHCFRSVCVARFVAPANVLGPNVVVAGPARPRPQPPILAAPRPALSTSKADVHKQKGQKHQDSDIVEIVPVGRKRQRLDVHRQAHRLPVPVTAATYQDGQRSPNAQGDGHRAVNVPTHNPPPVTVLARCWTPLTSQSQIALLRPAAPAALSIGSEAQQPPPPRPRMGFRAAAAAHAPPLARRLNPMDTYRILMVDKSEIFYPGSSAGNLWQSLEANSSVPRSVLDKVDAW